LSFIFNELSIHHQFVSIQEFKSALTRVLEFRQFLKSEGIEVRSPKSILEMQVTATEKFIEAVQHFERNQKSAILLWVTKQGPFWEEDRQHNADEYMEVDSEVVTDTAIGEAAWCNSIGIDRYLLSVSPSRWEFNPIHVTWFNGDSSLEIHVNNYWSINQAKDAIHAIQPNYNSWADLQKYSVSKFQNLSFNSQTFLKLNGCPYNKAAADRIVALLKTLNKLKSCFDEHGARTEEGNEIYQDFFTGQKGDGGRGALFTDSSDIEKIKFKGDMTFSHPDGVFKDLFCPFHGKVQTPQLRIHFSTPITHDMPLYIVHIGPKITK